MMSQYGFAHRFFIAVAALAVGTPCLGAIFLLDKLVVGDRRLIVHGLGDEASHLLTAVVVFVALVTLGIGVRPVAFLVGAMAIDLDHLLLILGDPFTARDQPSGKPLTGAG